MKKKIYKRDEQMKMADYNREVRRRLKELKSIRLERNKSLYHEEYGELAKGDIDVRGGGINRYGYEFATLVSVYQDWPMTLDEISDMFKSFRIAKFRPAFPGKRKPSD